MRVVIVEGEGILGGDFGRPIVTGDFATRLFQIALGRTCFIDRTKSYEIDSLYASSYCFIMTNPLISQSMYTVRLRLFYDC